MSGSGRECRWSRDELPVVSSLLSVARHSIETRDIDALAAKTVHAERSPKGKVEACVRFDSSPFDFAPLRSGRAGKDPAMGEGELWTLE
jgi:hypothetical protein